MEVPVIEFERQVACSGCFNFRDLGGYGTPDGRWTRPQRLYRADGPHALTDTDAATLAALGLKTIFDLRTPQEVDQRGCYTRVLADLVEYHLPMIDVLPDVEELPSWTDPMIVARRYRDMLDEGREVVGEILAVLSDPNAYPAMFHCSAGKDRTGIVAAMLLGILGLPDDTIASDYARSAAAMQHLVEYYQSCYPDAAEQLARLAPAMIAADPLTMHGFITGVRHDYGGFEGYAGAIGVGSAVPYIRSAMLT